MCIQAPHQTFSPHCLYCCARKSLRGSRENMSFQKKNVILGFRKEEYVPTADQMLVKYCSGKGNNLHEVECIDGSILLVSMPKKYRHTVWLKKEDCLVIDPIEEGKKVRGEIVCMLPFDAVRDLISSHQWPIPQNGTDVDRLLKFFTSSSERRPNRDEWDVFPSTDYSDMESDENEGEEEDDDGEEEEEEDEEANGEDGDDPEEGEEENSESESKATEDGNNDGNSQSPNSSNDPEDSTRDRNRSRVQLVTSGIVTVTNVLTEGLENDMQSLEFGADEEEESSDEIPSEGRDLQRHANTIRIQVNYDKET